MSKNNIKIIFELINDEKGGKQYFQISEKSSSVEEVHIALNVKNMTIEDKIFYNNIINVRKKNRFILNVRSIY
ncbi:hypothetical protein SCORR_v1c05330 [Spiroplasma corruscae]|uniref:Uncharacterized protein n=1 Tax=Spiroplasma corruscae TaxID=216934 RepID=A0A222EP63_9MOLU|nr:hypothetical protein [Spiroplasma corruscae]ASP28305.1 hypothetical protein SCORR_v1c05330 [Spiroplasma corruscae]